MTPKKNHFHRKIFCNIWLLILLNDILRNFLLRVAFIVVGSMSISPCNQSLVPSLFFYFKSIRPFLNSFTFILLPIGSVVLISVPKCNFTSHSNELLRRDLVHWFFGQSQLEGIFRIFTVEQIFARDTLSIIIILKY